MTWLLVTTSAPAPSSARDEHAGAGIFDGAGLPSVLVPPDGLTASMDTTRRPALAGDGFEAVARGRPVRHADGAWHRRGRPGCSRFEPEVHGHRAADGGTAPEEQAEHDLVSCVRFPARNWALRRDGCAPVDRSVTPSVAPGTRIRP